MLCVTPSSDRPTACADTYFSSQEVLASPDWHRINSLPWRTWTIEEGAELSAQLTPMLKAPQGRQSLLPIQAICLREAWEANGLFASISVSAGKTLISLLLPTVLGAKRPVLFVPAKLCGKQGKQGKTEKEIREYQQHWKITNVPAIRSYESVGVVSGKDSLDELSPDLIILDEFHKVRNPKASRTRRFDRYLKANPHVRVCVLTGSSIKRAIADYAHVIAWCLKDKAPTPLSQHTVEEWDLCLGEKLDMAFQRLRPGALMQWTKPGDIEALGLLNAARASYQRRFSSTRGVVCYHVAAEDIGVDIEFTGINLHELPGYHPDCAIEQAFDALRGKMELPDGQELVEGVEVYRHANEMKLGFFSKWKYPAPAEWLMKRKAFGSFVRSQLAGNAQYDSPEEVVRAFPEAREVLEWKAIKDTYDPETIIVWIDSGPLKRCVEWLKGGGIAFTQHIGFGEALAQLAGVPYFGAGGVDCRKQSIEHFQGKACVASLFANGEGRNLHLREHPANPNARLGFDRLLLVSCPRNGPELEQAIGRVHRLRCLAERVQVDLLVGCAEDILTFEQCLRDAELAKWTDGGEQKILQASIGNVLVSDELPHDLSCFSKSKAKRACARDLDVGLFLGVTDRR